MLYFYLNKEKVSIGAKELTESWRATYVERESLLYSSPTTLKYSLDWNSDAVFLPEQGKTVHRSKGIDRKLESHVSREKVYSSPTTLKYSFHWNSDAVFLSE